jgi:hypothetical protein
MTQAAVRQFDAALTGFGFKLSGEAIRYLSELSAEVVIDAAVRALAVVRESGSSAAQHVLHRLPREHVGHRRVLDGTPGRGAAGHHKRLAVQVWTTANKDGRLRREWAKRTLDLPRLGAAALREQWERQQVEQEATQGAWAGTVLRHIRVWLGAV